ncbi:hypothetical protein BGX34_007924 [Mortierella sp. NVP85]|nr:hypothetical protein BGX34_007924 [Mortierella sp. NVP85]
MTCPAGFTFEPLPHKSPFAEISETLEPGMQIDHFGTTYTWTDNHLPASRLAPLRRVGDELADNALEALKIKSGEDAYKALLAYVSRPEHEQESPAPGLLMKQLMTVPEWVDWDQVARGQQVFWRYCIFINQILLYNSLAGGFIAPGINKVLTSTGYLYGSKANERIWETSQFLLDVVHSLEYLTPGTGQAWKSIIQVRFLHAGVRARISKISRAHSKYYSVEEFGVPINQEDLLATLFSFSNTVWRGMEEKMNIIMPQQDREDYMHLWRYVGHVIGVDDVLGATRSPEMADAGFDSILMHIVDPSEESGKLTALFLKSMAPGPKTTKVINALGLPDPFKLHLVLTEGMVGKKMWKLFELPLMPKRYWFLKQMILWIGLVDLKLVSWMPWWFRLRSRMLRRIYARLITKNVGRERTKFELKVVPKTMQDGEAENHHPMEGFKAADRLWPMALTAVSLAIAVGYFRRSKSFR